MALSFPTSPSAGQQYVGDGVTYQYDNTLPAWVKLQPVQAALTGAAAQTSAALLPGGDDAERAAITAPTVGMLRYNDQTLPATIEYYDGSGWVTMAVAGGSGDSATFGAWPNIRVIGMSSATAPTPGFWGQAINNPVTYFQPGSTAPGVVALWAPTSGAYKEIQVSNAALSYTVGTVDPGITKITLDAGGLALASNVTLSSLTAIEGQGYMWRLVDNAAYYPALTSISTNIKFIPSVPAGGTGSTSFITLGSSPLDATSVNHIFESTVANGGLYTTGKDITITGVGAAGAGALTPAGNTAKNALVAAGWTVTINP